MATVVRSMTVPADVPASKRSTYEANFQLVTKGTGNLALFAGDQKVEHLNDDFYGKTSQGPIAAEDNDPEHLFRIAQQGVVGCFAAQFGLVARYGMDYADVPYLVTKGSKAGARPTPHSQTCVAGRRPRAIRALFTGWSRSQSALRDMMSVSRRLPVPRGKSSTTGLSIRSCGGVARRSAASGAATPALPCRSKQADWNFTAAAKGSTASSSFRHQASIDRTASPPRSEVGRRSITGSMPTHAGPPRVRTHQASASPACSGRLMRRIVAGTATIAPR